MLETYPLITSLVASIVLAFVFGYTALLVKLPPLLGYLLAGMMLGPNTPGFVADQEIAAQLAEIGIILLMFGVGLHFSLKDLMKARQIALPGALFQMIIATLIGALFLLMREAEMSEALVFGFSLSVASTVVLLRALEDNGEIDTAAGRIAVGWLIVEDIAMVLAIVLLPVFAATAVDGAEFNLIATGSLILTTLFKITVFAICMIIFGRKLLPVLLEKVAYYDSKEITSLCSLAIALGFAYLAYMVFGASFALGAFFAGMVLNESEIGKQSAEQSLPLRNTFAVLFFVAVGMLFDPTVLIDRPLGVICVFLIIVLGKGIAAYVVTYLFKQKHSVSLMIAASLAQIGEFSFIFAGMALSLGLMPQHAYDLILAGALLSIAVNPLLFKFIGKPNLAHH